MKGLSLYLCIMDEASLLSRHHEPDTCSTCSLQLEPFRPPDPSFPLPAFICPQCRTVSRCACDDCEEAIDRAYGLLPRQGLLPL